MLKNLMIGTLGLLVLGTTLAAQPAEISKERIDAAMARLREEQAATTQPAVITNGELAKLRSELAALRAENGRLRAEIAKLKAAQATAAPALGQAGTGGPANEINKAIAEHRLANGMTVAEAERALGVKLEQTQDSSDGTIYLAVVHDKTRPNPSSGAEYTGTDYTIVIRDGVISSWQSARFFMANGGVVYTIGTDGVAHRQ